MRRRFLLAFAALFVLFATGIGVSLFLIWRGSTELRQVLTLHQVDDIRQGLSRSLQRTQLDLQVSGTAFARPLEEVVADILQLDRSIQGCFDCHHEPALLRDLEGVVALVDTYGQQHSAYLAASSGAESRQVLRSRASATADEAREAIEAMLLSAGTNLARRSEAATARVERSWQLLIVTLVLTFLAAIAISLALTRSVTRPLDALVQATYRIGEGNLGYRLDHRERDEMGALMDAFNYMSGALEANTGRVEGHLEKLQHLNRSVAAVYAKPDEEDLFAWQVRAIDELIDVEVRGSIVRTGLKDVFLVSLSRKGETSPEYQNVISADRLESTRRRERRLLVVPDDELDGWPFGAWAVPEPLRNYLVCWVEWRREFQGALLAINKTSGGIEPEDGELLLALGQAIGPAMQVAGANEDLQEGMLQEAMLQPDRGREPSPRD